MSNKEMVVYKESLITKIKKFFKNLFGKDTQENDTIQAVVETKEQEVKTDEKKAEFLNDLKVDTKKIDVATKRRAFLEKVEGNEEELNKLSMKDLEKLEKYYDKIIEQNNEKIKKLKATA